MNVMADMARNKETPTHTRSALNDSSDSISIHYSPAEDLYWSQNIVSDEGDTEKGDQGSEGGLWAPLLLDGLTSGSNGKGPDSDGFGYRRPKLPNLDAMVVNTQAEISVEERWKRLRIFVEPARIDTGILRKFQDPYMDRDVMDCRLADDPDEEYKRENGPLTSNSARDFLLENSQAISQLLKHQNTRHKNCTYLPHNTHPYSWLSSLIRTLPHNSPTYPSPPPPPSGLPSLLDDPMLTSLWVRNKLQSRWSTKYRHTLAAELGALKVLAHQADMTGNDKTRIVASGQRRLHRKVFDECVQEVLTEIGTSLQYWLRGPLADIDRTAALWKAQRCLLLNEHCTLSEAFDAFAQRQDELCSHVDDVLSDLDDRLDVVSSLLSAAEEAMRKRRTRYNRLCAEDVKDPLARKREMERRLQRPEALVYLLKSWEDVFTVEQVAWAIVERLEDGEGVLALIGRMGTECVSLAEEIVLIE